MSVFPPTRGTGVGPVVLDAGGTGKRAAASLLGDATGETGLVCAQAVLGRDLGTRHVDPHSGMEMVGGRMMGQLHEGPGKQGGLHLGTWVDGDAGLEMDCGGDRSIFRWFR